MTGHPSQTRKPYDAAPYASLRQVEATAAAAKGDPAAAASPAADFNSEAAGLPNTLIDLTMAYTNALRLQLNLKSIAARQHLATTPRPAGQVDKS